MSYVIDLYEKSSTNLFPYFTCTEVDRGLNERVYGVLVLMGIGEAIPNATLKKASEHPMWRTEGDHSLYTSVERWKIVYVFVQTTVADAYLKGEIYYGLKILHEKFNLIGKPSVISISLGGFGFLQWADSIERAIEFYMHIAIMPGGNGGIGQKYPSAAVGAGLKNMFLHAKDDKVALPIQSIAMNAAISDQGGESSLVMYESGGHSITTRPLQAFYPPAMYNNTNKKVVAGSDKPTLSIYEMICSQPVVVDKLLLTQQVWQRSDDSVYTKDI